MSDIICAHCAEPYDVDYLRHDEGHEVYRQVLSGKGCPDCGFDHSGDGPHRQTQLEQLVFDGVTDDDPLEFLCPGNSPSSSYPPTSTRRSGRSNWKSRTTGTFNSLSTA